MLLLSITLLLPLVITIVVTGQQEQLGDRQQNVAWRAGHAAGT